ncbi:head-tail connector protein [Alicyclobacillus shizuokensis]|uniref:head-tail connector protein n=1 Tax=Alicyclobacillus shizuokensis TaxID=392014 RepID=UPI000833B11D|nr:head-tail connector protein [Alicyclobacillus shizuokensis]
MLLTMEQARDALRLDGTDNDAIIEDLLNAISSYVEVATGRRWDADDPIHPLAQTVAKFLLQLWYFPQDTNTTRLDKSIDSLLTALTNIGRSMS